MPSRFIGVDLHASNLLDEPRSGVDRLLGLKRARPSHLSILFPPPPPSSDIPPYSKLTLPPLSCSPQSCSTPRHSIQGQHVFIMLVSSFATLFLDYPIDAPSKYQASISTWKHSTCSRGLILRRSSLPLSVLSPPSPYPMSMVSFSLPPIFSVTLLPGFLSVSLSRTPTSRRVLDMAPPAENLHRQPVYGSTRG